MAKRSNGEGSIRRRPDGRWEFRLMDGYLADGRRNQLSFYGKTQKEARAKAAAYQENRKNGLDLTVEHTFASWADFWFENHRSNITPATQQNYRYVLKTLKAHLGSRRLRDIKALDIENFLRDLRNEGLSDSYLASARGMLFQIFNKAEANDLILKNPVRLAEKMRASREAPKRKEAFTTEEVRLLMENLPRNRIGYSIRLMLGTGMRTQELLGLEPRFIAEDGSLIQIRQALVQVKGSVMIGPPKSRDSYRDIPVPPNLRYCAIALRNTPDRFIWEAGIKGQPCNPSHFRRKYREAPEEVEGVRILTPHSCRHTYVTQMQALGVDMSTIQSIVGHAEVDMTEHYLHVQEPIRQDAVNRFSDAFEQPSAAKLKII